MTRYNAHVQFDPLSEGTELRIVRRSEPGSGHSNVALSISDLAFVKHGERIPRACDPTVAKDIVQTIMDAGWAAGLRPAGYEDEKSSIKRMEYHLEDMRKLVFDGEK